MSRSTFPRMIAACCVLLILGNSVALAANATLPGDTLYPVKVNVLEPARAIVTVSAEGKATWASTCIRRRLIEAERLIAEDRLTTETWKSLNDSIASNTRVAERHIIRLSKQNAPEAVDLSADLHLMINAHGQVFSDVGETHQQEAVITAAADLSSAAADTGRLYQETEELAAANVMNVEETAVRVMESASSAAFTLGEAADATVQTIPDQAKERGDIARQFLTSAKNRFQAGEFKESLRDARMAVQKAEEGKAFVRMALPFTIGASSNGSMMAVPITVCGSAIINVSVPAVAEPTQQPTSSASSKKNESSSSEQSIVSQVSSQSSSSSVPASTSSSSTIDSSSSVVVSSSKTETPSSTSTQTSSIASRNSSKPLIELPPLVPELPLLH